LRLGRIEILLVILLICAAVYMGIQYLPSGRAKQCAPVPLSPEVKAYIDKQLAAHAGNAQCGDIPAVLSRVTEMETKMAAINKFEQMRNDFNARREQTAQVVQATRQTQTDILTNLRNAELARLRNEMAMMCAGVTVRSGGGAGALGAQPGGGARLKGGNGNVAPGAGAVPSGDAGGSNSGEGDAAGSTQN
jgi:DNA-binding XRE family transcriptional regulator